MRLDPEVCERARVSRDARFDGRFFVGVTTTGVYCRSVCPVRLPRPENVIFFPTRAAAVEAGFRPCLRCRPEAAPGAPTWVGPSVTVTRALQRISDGALDHGTLAELAASLGVGARQLSRLFAAHVGASPQTVSQTRRLHCGKKLLDETDLSIAEIAMSAGYGSVRRFNAHFKEVYGRTPSQLRAPARNGAHPHKREVRAGRDLGETSLTGLPGYRGRAVERDVPAGLRSGAMMTSREDDQKSDAVLFRLRLSFRPPYCWADALDFFARRAVPGMEIVRGTTYARTILVDGLPGLLSVSPVPGENYLLCETRLSGARFLFDVAERVRRVFDLDADPLEIENCLLQDPEMTGFVQGNPGLRLLGCWDGFEAAVRAVLEQRVSFAAARTLTRRLVDAFGAVCETSEINGADGELCRLFPSPEQLVGVERSELAALGIAGMKATGLLALSQAVCSGAVSFDPGQDLESFAENMTALPGIGPWTAHYTAMRAFGFPDSFLHSDLVLVRRAEELLGKGAPFTPARLFKRAEVWRPWRAYASLYLWRWSPDQVEQ